MPSDSTEAILSHWHTLPIQSYNTVLYKRYALQYCEECMYTLNMRPFCRNLPVCESGVTRRDKNQKLSPQWIASRQVVLNISELIPYTLTFSSNLNPNWDTK